jgi:DNA-binding IclR family transcriptional regulator
VLDRDRLLVLAQEESPERVRLSIEVGGVFDPACTASGRLLLAQLDEPQRSAVLAASETGSALVGRKRDVFNATLEEIRGAGMSTAESETIEGVRDLAVLVGNPTARITAALAITRLVRRDGRGNDAALVAKLRTAASTITQTLGLEIAA